MCVIYKILVIGVLLSTVNANSGIVTGPVINPANGHSYYLLDTDGYKWWFAAETEAVSLGGHLVTINDAAENQWILDTFATDAINYASAHSLPDAAHISFWIGYSDAQQEGVWIWASGQSNTYTNWQSGEPSGGNADEDFGAMIVSWWAPGKWHDVVGTPRFVDLPFGVVEVVPELTCDMDEDGDVDLVDFGILSADWGRDIAVESLLNEKTDVNDDGIVDIADLRLFAAEWLGYVN